MKWLKSDWNTHLIPCSYVLYNHNKDNTQMYTNFYRYINPISIFWPLVPIVLPTDHWSLNLSTCSFSVKTRRPKLQMMLGVGSPVASQVNVICSSNSEAVWFSRNVILGCTVDTQTQEFKTWSINTLLREKKQWFSSMQLLSLYNGHNTKTVPLS